MVDSINFNTIPPLPVSNANNNQAGTTPQPTTPTPDNAQNTTPTAPTQLPVSQTVQSTAQLSPDAAIQRQLLAVETLLPASEQAELPPSPQQVTPSPVTQPVSQPVQTAATLNTVVTGIIIGTNAAGNSILQTANSQIAFSSDSDPPVGSQVKVDLQTINNNYYGRVLSINGEPNPNAAALTNTTIAQAVYNQVAASVPTQGNAPQQSNTTLSQNNAVRALPQALGTAGSTVTGVLISQQAATQPPANPAATGTQFTLRVVPPESLIAPAAAVGNVSNVAIVTVENAQNNPSSGGGGGNLGAGNQPHDGASTLPNTPQTTSALSTPTTSIALQLPGQVFTAKVIGTTTGGETVIKTPLGLIKLSSLSDLEAGKDITFEILSAVDPQTASLTASTTAAASPAINTSPTPVTVLAQQWSAVQQIFNLLSGRVGAGSFLPLLDTDKPDPTSSDDAQASEEESNTLSSHSLTESAQHLTSGLFSFISNLRKNDFKSWVGKENIKWLSEQGHDAAITKATEDFHTLSKQFSATSPQTWQPLFFPVVVDGQVQQVRLYVKQDENSGKKTQEGTDKDTRFVVELDLSRLGEIQMDGFVRKSEKNITFNMIIRSLTPLPQDVEKDLSAIFQTTAELTGYKGDILFQAVKEFPVNPMNDIVTRHNTITA